MRTIFPQQFEEIGADRCREQGQPSDLMLPPFDARGMFLRGVKELNR
jgi:hypothetical protein